MHRPNQHRKSVLPCFCFRTTSVTGIEILECTSEGLSHPHDLLSIIVSHTGCHAVYKHDRNLPDDVLKEVVRRGGIVGIFTITFFLDEERNDLVPFLRHIEHAVEVCGEDAVAIGGDGPYCYQDPVQMAVNFVRLKDKLDPDGRLKARNPDHPLELNTSRRMEVVATELLRHFSPETVTKVVGGNFVRFLHEVL